jgi:hypothetical protein
MLTAIHSGSLPQGGYVCTRDELLDALGKAVNERQIAVWSRSPDEQKFVGESRMAHAISDGAALHAQVVINNLAGDGLDYRLDRNGECVAEGCSGATSMSAVNMRLINKASTQSLPEYAVCSTGFVRQRPVEAPPGTIVSSAHQGSCTPMQVAVWRQTD